jgi:hypothetical protein
MALVSPTFQIDLRKFCSGWEGLKLQQIDDMFQGAGIGLGPETAARSGGDRQKLTQRYLSTINWDSEEDVEKVLQAVTIALFGESTSREHKEKLRTLCEKEGLQIEEKQVVLAGDRPSAKKAPPIRRRSPVAEFEIFVSWSQPGSRQAAEAFREWLPRALPGVSAWMSKEDITKGRPWFAAVSEQLSRSKACLICVTPENVKSPWLFYEAGAVAHAMPGALICSYLIGVTPSALAGTPLREFQTTVFDKEDTRRLIRDLNRQLDTPHDEVLLRSAFDKNWTSLQKKLNKVVSAVNTPDKPDEPDDPDLSS